MFVVEIMSKDNPGNKCTWVNSTSWSLLTGPWGIAHLASVFRPRSKRVHLVLLISTKGRTRSVWDGRPVSPPDYDGLTVLTYVRTPGCTLWCTPFSAISYLWSSVRALERETTSNHISKHTAVGVTEEAYESPNKG